MIITVALQRVEGDDLHSSGVVHSYIKIKKKKPVKVYFLVLES